MPRRSHGIQRFLPPPIFQPSYCSSSCSSSSSSSSGTTTTNTAAAAAAACSSRQVGKDEAIDRALREGFLLQDEAALLAELGGTAHCVAPLLWIVPHYEGRCPEKVAKVELKVVGM